MVGLPVAVFLHNRFSGLLLFSLLRRSHQVRLAGPPSSASFFDSAYISLRCYVYTPCSMPRSARGGLYLNNIHELRYTRQIYCSDTRGFSQAPQPTATLSFSLRHRFPPSFSPGPGFLPVPRYSFLPFRCSSVYLRSSGITRTSYIALHSFLYRVDALHG